MITTFCCSADVGDTPVSVQDVAAVVKENPDVQLFIFSELYLSGYGRSGTQMKCFRRECPEFELLAQLSQKSECCIIVGFAESASGLLYNSSGAFHKGKLAAVHRKRVLWGPWEHATFTGVGADHPQVFDVFGVRVAMLICFEVEFPEFVRRAALSGTELLAVPTAVGQSKFPMFCIPAAAYANHMCIAYVNNPRNHCGEMSVVAFPDGSVATNYPKFTYEPQALPWRQERERNPYLQLCRDARLAALMSSAD